MKCFIILMVVCLPNIIYAQSDNNVDTLPPSLAEIYGYEPTYLLIKRARERGIQRAIEDDIHDRLIIYRHYKGIDTTRTKIVADVLQNKYGLKFIPLSGILSDETIGYAYQATRIAEAKFGKDFWGVVEQEVDSIAKNTGWSLRGGYGGDKEIKPNDK